MQKFAKLEACKALKLVYKFLHLQVKIRPRLRLFTKVLIALVGFFIVSSQLVAYIKPKEAEVKINGRAILVAQQKDEKPDPELEVELNQNITSRLSPFEFQEPVENGYLSQGYRAYHPAFDIATNLGATIRPLGTGFVEFAGRVADGKGNIVIIDHGDGLKSLYAHMGKIEVGVGDIVNSDSKIGTVGLTGRTTGPHVHLEIYDNGKPINPDSVLPE